MTAGYEPMTPDDPYPRDRPPSSAPHWLMSALLLALFLWLAWQAWNTEPLPPTPPGAGTPEQELWGDVPLEAD